MIFNCPRCSAGHSVPVSMIPSSGGLEMTCRRCNAAFHVTLAERTDSGGLRAKVSEATGVTEDASDEGVATAVRVSSAPSSLTVEPGEVAVRVTGVPAPPREEPHDTAIRITVPPATPSGPPGAPPSVYEQVELGVRVLAARRSSSWTARGGMAGSGRGEGPLYAEPTATGGRMLGPLRRLAEKLNRAPLALKVALVVFPATLGVALVMTSGRYRVSEPVQIPIARASGDLVESAKSPKTQRVPEATAESHAAERATPEPSSTAGAALAEPIRRQGPAPAASTADLASKVERPHVSSAGDEPAPRGFTYVQVDQARLRSIANEDGPIAGRLELGKLVREVERAGDWVLVMVMPEGPAGFINTRLLGPTKPIALLAREIAFSGCRATASRSRDDCLFEGKQQHDACLQSCSVAVAVPGMRAGSAEARGAGSSVRCAEACRVAFDECARHCNEPVEDRAPPKKRRVKPRPR